MALRVRIPHTSRGQQGAVPTSASMFVYKRGTTTQINCYLASTGGSAQTQPLAPDANGQYAFWIEDVQQVDLVETINGVVMPTIQWEAGAAILEAWTAVSFTNAWVNFGAPFANVSYCKTDEWIVKLQGVMKTGTINLPAFTLPAGYRPANTLIYPIISNGAIGRLDISAAGVVTPVAGNNTYVSLDNIMFRGEQ